MKITVDIKPWELEPDDTIAGMPAKALVAFAATVKKAGITDDDLKQFIKDAERIAQTVREEYDSVMREAVTSLYRPGKPWEG